MSSLVEFVATTQRRHKKSKTRLNYYCKIDTLQIAAFTTVSVFATVPHRPRTYRTVPTRTYSLPHRTYLGERDHRVEGSVVPPHTYSRTYSHSIAGHAGHKEK